MGSPVLSDWYSHEERQQFPIEKERNSVYEISVDCQVKASS